MRSAESGHPTEQETDALRSSAASILRVYIASYSMPLQGPISGSVRWVTRAEAQRAIETLEQLAGAGR